MYHGCHSEGELVTAERECIAFFYCLQVGGFLSEELFYHLCGFCCADDCRLRIAEKERGNEGSMVRFHVVDDEVVEGATRECCLYILEELFADCDVCSIEERGLLI